MKALWFLQEVIAMRLEPVIVISVTKARAMRMKGRWPALPVHSATGASMTFITNTLAVQSFYNPGTGQFKEPKEISLFRSKSISDVINRTIFLSSPF